MENSKIWQRKDGKFHLEKEAFLLALEYYNHYHKVSFKHINPAKVKNSKYWKFFTKTVELYGQNKEWNYRKFIKIIFENEKIIYPQQLPQKRFWELYVDNIRVGEENKTKEIALKLLGSYNTIKRWSNNKKFDYVNFKDFFRNKHNMLFLKQSGISIYFLSICKPFKEYYESLDLFEREMLFTKRKLNSSRRAIIMNKKLLEKMKEVLKEDFNGEEF